METLELTVKNFGPITKGTVQFKPLTVFVGSNNTGKSYMAQLLYALSRVRKEMLEIFQSISTAYPPSRFLARERFSDLYVPFSTRTVTLDGRTLNAFERLLPKNWSELVSRPMHMRGRDLEVHFDSLPQKLKGIFESYLTDSIGLFEYFLDRELVRCYDAKLSDLVCKLGDHGRLTLDIKHDEPMLQLSYEVEGNHLTQVKQSLSLHGQVIKTTLPRMPIRVDSGRLVTGDQHRRILIDIVNRFFGNSFQSLLDVFPKQSFYLPAARSGILHGQKAIATAGFRTMQRRAGIEPISIPKFPGVVIDFLEAIYSIDKNERSRLYSLARHLEEVLTLGRIEFVEGKQEAPEIYFREPKVGRLRLHRTSSMVSELAPVILLLKYLVSKGNTIIIEEPESHMHPAAQREIAKILVKLVRNGVNVLLTTHSDYLLQQISNLVSLSVKPDAQVEKLGYSKAEVVHPEEVGAYLFKRTSGDCGSIIEAIEVGENGILEDEFVNVAESLYHETIEAKRIRGSANSSESQR
jgi:predicted ATPase